MRKIAAIGSRNLFANCVVHELTEAIDVLDQEHPIFLFENAKLRKSIKLAGNRFPVSTRAARKLGMSRSRDYVGDFALTRR
jgi:hypothetical protein